MRLSHRNNNNNNSGSSPLFFPPPRPPPPPPRAPRPLVPLLRHYQILQQHCPSCRLVLVSIFFLCYGYAFFRFQPDRSYEHVSAWNTALSARYHAIRLEKIQAQRALERIIQEQAQEEEVFFDVDNMNANNDNVLLQTKQKQQQGKIVETADNGASSFNESLLLSYASNTTTSSINSSSNLRSDKNNKNKLLHLISLMLLFSTCSALLQLYVRSAYAQHVRSLAYPNPTQQQQQQHDDFREMPTLSSTTQSAPHHQRLLNAMRQREQQRQQQQQQQERMRRIMEVEEEDGGGGGRGATQNEMVSNIIAGATQQEIDHQCPITRVFQYNDDDELSSSSTSCAICLERYKAGDQLRTMSPYCLHAFHKSCIDTWLRQMATCPVCKHGITSSSGN